MTISLSQNIDAPNSKYLVFTSAGDYAKLHHWLKGYRNFDLWISYYGDKQNQYKYKEYSDFYIAKKGGKFPALHYVYQHWQSILDHYQAILVIDDDIVIDGSAISRLFEIREQYDLWLLQPAFSPIGKVSHPITMVKPFTFLRYTNLVELGCPLFRRDKLDAFMKIYDPALVGYGIDLWYMDLLIPNDRKVAVVDAISCINPRDRSKGGQREIDILQDAPTRIKNWIRIKEQYNIEVREPMELGSIKSPLSLSAVIRAITNSLVRAAFKCLRTFRNVTSTLKRTT